MRTRLKTLYAALGRWDKVFLALLLLYGVLRLVTPAGTVRGIAGLAVWIVGMVVGVRWIVRLTRRAIWRLRNRLIVCYLFMAVVPIALILVLVGLSAWVITGQVAVHLVASKIQSEIDTLAGPSIGLLQTAPPNRSDRLGWVGPYLRQRFPGYEFLLREGREWRFPADSTLEMPPQGWGDTAGIMVSGSNAYFWAHSVRGSGEMVCRVPINRETLSALIPDLGDVSLLLAGSDVQYAATPGPGGERQISKITIRELPQPQADVTAPATRSRVPPPTSRLDLGVFWGTLMPVALWESPGTTEERVLGVWTRPSAVLRTVYSQKAEVGEVVYMAFLIVAGMFFLVELVSFVIGLSITRTVTGAVHNLYEGTQRVMQGDFTHRVTVRGNDQLAALSHSFNRMNENLERLLAVEKEQQRLQSELEIAREVQSQLFPKGVPEMRTLQLTARCTPARMVSGDYYDYLKLRESRLALALGDVAGKGISAALLMAAVQSTMRTHLTSMEWANSGNGGGWGSLTAAGVVTRLNAQLYANTSPEKYATFYFALYDEDSSVLTYTNAGHLPPILLRRGQAIRLDVNGMVVGAFPFAQYEQSQIELARGDLLVCFTDGITEPENEYGEMFGEERLIQVVARHADHPSDEIIDAAVAAVQEWTGSPELQDDMTVIVARKL